MKRNQTQVAGKRSKPGLASQARTSKPKRPAPIRSKRQSLAGNHRLALERAVTFALRVTLEGLSAHSATTLANIYGEERFTEAEVARELGVLQTKGCAVARVADGTPDKWLAARTAAALRQKKESEDAQKQAYEWLVRDLGLDPETATQGQIRAAIKRQQNAKAALAAQVDKAA